MPQFRKANLKQKDKMVIHTPDISKNFILNSAVRDATYILLKPYLTPSVSSSYNSNTHIHTKDGELIDSEKGFIGKYQYFLTLMATIAWDFLNVSNIFDCNIKQQIKKDS